MVRQILSLKIVLLANWQFEGISLQNRNLKIFEVPMFFLKIKTTNLPASFVRARNKIVGRYLMN